MIAFDPDPITNARLNAVLEGYAFTAKLDIQSVPARTVGAGQAWGSTSGPQTTPNLYKLGNEIGWGPRPWVETYLLTGDK